MVTFFSIVAPDLVEQVNALQELWEMESDIGDYISEVNVLLTTLSGARSESLNASTSQPRAKRPMLRRTSLSKLIGSVHNTYRGILESAESTVRMLTDEGRV